MLHPRGDLLPDVAALAEIDAVQRFEPGFEDVGVGSQFHPGLGDAVRDADRLPVAAVVRFRFGTVGAPAKGRMARVGQGVVGRRAGAPVQVQPGLLDGDLRAQLVHGEAPHEVVGQPAGDVEQDIVAVALEQKIGKVLALRGEKGGIDQTLLQLADVVGDEVLQEMVCIRARYPEDAARGHVPAPCVFPPVI